MKKLFRFGIVSLALGLCLGAGALAAKGHNSFEKADANTVNGVEMVLCPGDTTSYSTLFSSCQPTSDSNEPDYLNWSDLSSSNTSYFTLPAGASTSSLTVIENEFNKKHNYCYYSFFAYPRVANETGIAPKTRYTIEVSFTLTLRKNTEDGGGAYAHAELFLLGYHNITSNKLIPTLTNSRFDVNNDKSISYSTGYKNSTETNASFGCYTKTGNSDISTTTITKHLVFDNTSTSQQVSRYQLGLLVGCNYGSSKTHRAQATVTYNIESVVKESIVATSGSTSYTSFNDAVQSVSSGSTINLINSCSCNMNVNSTHFRKNLTINLQGNTLSMAAYDNGICVPSGYTWTINGGGGIIQNNNLDNANTESVIIVGGTLTLSNVTVNKPNGASPTVSVSGTMTADSSVTILSNSAYNNGYALHVTGLATLNGSTVRQTNSISAVLVSMGGTLKSNGATINANYQYAIEVDYASSTIQNFLYLWGNTTLTHGSSAQENADILMSAAGSRNAIYANNGSSTYLTKAVKVRIYPNYYNDGTTVVYGDNNSKVTITSGTPTGYHYKRANNNITYEREEYTISFNANGGTGTIASMTVLYNNGINMPAADAFTAPAYRSFYHWNDEPDDSGSITRNAGASYYANRNVTFYAIWRRTEMDTYAEFLAEYLHMDDYTVEKGWCLDSDSHHYYADAKDYFFNEMTKGYRTYFASHYSDGWNRLLAWAKANGETIVFDNGANDYVIQSSTRFMGVYSDSTNSTFILVAVISAISLSSIGCLIFVIRKRKHR